MINIDSSQQTKVCTKCKIPKELEEFHKEINGKYRVASICKICKKSYTSVYYENNKEDYKNYNKNYKILNKNNILLYAKEYYQNNKELSKQYNKIYVENNQDYIKNYRKEYYKDNEDEKKKYALDYNKNNRKKINQRVKNRYENDPEFRIRVILCNTIYYHLKRSKIKKSVKTVKLLGCSIKESKVYLENQFLPEMSWDNHGIIWEIDHIKPCSKFNLLNEEEQKECFHYTNLQPLFKTTEIAQQFGYKDQIGNRNKLNKCYETNNSNLE